jgi:hypothetical protein
MLELHAGFFLEAVTELTRLRTLLYNNPAFSNADDEVALNTRELLYPINAKVIEAISNIGARAARISAVRLQDYLKDGLIPLNIGRLKQCLDDIESRFADELQFIKLFVIREDKAVLFEGADKLIGEHAASLYPSIWFDCEEAAKCLGLGRSTACVFHNMRMLEIAIRALSKRLSIPEAEKVSDRNWGNMLNMIKGAIDRLYPKHKRLPDSEGSALKLIYVSLDAIKNPWRNATMHVEHVYIEEEARHILTCTATLIQLMAKDFDEEGVRQDSRLLALEVQP